MTRDPGAIYAHFVIAAFLDLGAGHWVEDLRRRFDPLAYSVPAHVTLVHPFQTKIELKEVADHLDRVASTLRPFRLVCQGVTGHEDEYLFLNIKRGSDGIIGLRDALYTDVLAGKRTDSVTFLPHVTVGRVRSLMEFSNALAVAREYDGRVTTFVDAITCYGITGDDQRTVLTSHRLGGGGPAT